MDNEEFRSIIAKALGALGIVIVICIPVALFYFSKYKFVKSSITDHLYDKETFVLYVYEEKADKGIMNLLEQINIKYYECNINEEDDFDNVLLNLSLTEDDVKPWALIYVEDGVASSNTNNYEDVEGFFKYNNLIEK